MTRRVLVGVLAALVLTSGIAEAQEQLMARFYLVPKIGVGTVPDPFRAKYVRPDELGAGWNIVGRYVSMDYGFENAFLVKADVTPSEHTTLSAQTDVLAVPADLDTLVSGAALPTVQSKLEALNLPASWVTTSHTYRQVMRTVRRVITFMQRYQGLFPADRVFAAGITLDTRLNQMTAAQRSRLQDVAVSLGLDTSGVTNTLTIRQALRVMADQLPDIAMGSETL
jgi:hypothetical protein